MKALILKPNKLFNDLTNMRIKLKALRDNSTITTCGPEGCHCSDFDRAIDQIDSLVDNMFATYICQVRVSESNIKKELEYFDLYDPDEKKVTKKYLGIFAKNTELLNEIRESIKACRA